MPPVSATPSAVDASFATKHPVLVLVFAVLVGILIALVCIGGGAYFLLKTGKIHTGPLLVFTEKASVAAVTTHTISLDPILVNLADPSGHGYLRLGLALVLEDGPEPASGASAAHALNLPREREIPIRDTVLAVLGQQTSGVLLQPDGKDRLKQELQTALALHNPDLKVRGLYFSDFLVQP
jgi:flagellar protein FliL